MLYELIFEGEGTFKFEGIPGFAVLIAAVFAQGAQQASSQAADKVITYVPDVGSQVFPGDPEVLEQVLEAIFYPFLILAEMHAIMKEVIDVCIVYFGESVAVTL